MIDCKDLDYVALAEMEEKELAGTNFKVRELYVAGVDKETGTVTLTRTKPSKYSEEYMRGYIEALDWMLNQTMTGMTLPMLRVVIHNKRVEISGEGQKA